MQEKYININTLKVSEKLSQFISDELLKETDLSVDNFWSGFEKTVNELAPKNKELREIYETRNMREAIELIFSRKFVFNKKNLLEIHKIVVKDTGVNFGFKKLPNFIISRNLKTTSPENVEKEIAKLVEFYEENKNRIYPPQLAALVHAKFEKIHPFEDGNGRMGRLLMNFILDRSGFPMIDISVENREDYIQALDSGKSENLTKFIYKELENYLDELFKE